jgi:hypothetical protein
LPPPQCAWQIDFAAATQWWVHPDEQQSASAWQTFAAQGSHEPSSGPPTEQTP